MRAEVRGQFVVAHAIGAGEDRLPGGHAARPVGQEPLGLLLLLGAGAHAHRAAVHVVFRPPHRRLFQRASRLRHRVRAVATRLHSGHRPRLTRYTRRAVIADTMAKADTLPVQIQLSEAQYLVLLKHATNRSRVSARLIAAVEHERKGKRASYVFTGFLTDGLALRALALVHAPDAVPAIEKALKRAREK
jgi:hypothetical protein